MENIYCSYALLGLRKVLVKIFDKEVAENGLELFEGLRMRGRFYRGKWCLCGMVVIPGMMYPDAFAKVINTLKKLFPFEVQFRFSSYSECDFEAFELLENKRFFNLRTQADEACGMVYWPMSPKLDRVYPSMFEELSGQKFEELIRQKSDDEID